MEDTIDFLKSKIVPMTVTLDGDCAGTCKSRRSTSCQHRYHLGELKLLPDENNRVWMLYEIYEFRDGTSAGSAGSQFFYLDEANTDVRLWPGFSNCETQNPVVVVYPRGGSGHLAEIYVKSMEEGEKIRKALVHLIKLSGGKEPIDENLFD